MTQPLRPDLSEDPAIFRYLAANRHLAHMLTAVLPPPPDDTPEARLYRDTAGVAAVAALLPANPTETGLAVSHVAANAHAMECLRVANTPDIPLDKALKCLAQSASMLRQALSALRALERMQAIRARREGSAEQAGLAARTEHVAASALAGNLPDADAVLPQAPEALPESPPEPSPKSPLGLDDETAHATEAYVHIYPKRAALIRRHGGVPADVSFGPPDPAIVEALVTGTSTLLCALDDAEDGTEIDTKIPKMIP